MHSQLNFFFRCIGERKVFEALDDYISFIWIYGLGLRRLDTVLVGNILWLDTSTIIFCFVRLVLFTFVEKE